MKKQIAVILTGCGHLDGSEITEAVSSLIALTEAGAEYKVFAPTAKMEESARISRGKIDDIKNLKADAFDGLVMPGGYGAAKHLCTWATEGAKCSVNPEAERVIKEFYAQEKPIAAICIAPALVAKVLGDKGVTVTIGDDKDTAAEIKKTGTHHENCAVTDFITDREHRVVTTPAYMYNDAKPAEIFTGIRKAIRELIEMA